MANDNFPRGLVPLVRGGGRVSGRYYLASTAADIYIGQPVVFGTDGRVTATATGGASGLVVLGVVGGVTDWNKAGLAADVGIVPKPYYDVSDLPGGQTGYVFVYDDPMQEYFIQENTASTRLQLTDIGATANHIFRGLVGNTVIGSSAGHAQFELDAASIAATGSGAFQILGLLDGFNTDGTIMTTGNYAKWIVRISRPQRAGGVYEAAV